MTIQVDFWQLVMLLVAFLGASTGAGKALLAQYDRRQEDRYRGMEKTREAEQTHWDAKFSSLENMARDEAGQWARVERELMSLKAELPLQYVRREDYIRGQSVIEAKLDGLALKIENIILRGATP